MTRPVVLVGHLAHDLRIRPMPPLEITKTVFGDFPDTGIRRHLRSPALEREAPRPTREVVEALPARTQGRVTLVTHHYTGATKVLVYHRLVFHHIDHLLWQHVRAQAKQGEHVRVEGHEEVVTWAPSPDEAPRRVKQIVVTRFELCPAR